MKISDYLREIQHAVTTIITEIHREHDEVAALRRQLEALSAATEEGYGRADFLAMNPELDDDFLGTAIYWDTYFGPDKERFHKSAQTDEAARRVATHELSIAALAGSLLQYAKQGLSLRFGNKRAGCPNGRIVGGMQLHEIIWQGRNQAIHWEDGAFHKPTEQCFQELAANVDPVFKQYKSRSLAYEVVRLLGWKTFDDFARDMSLFDV